MKNKLTISLIIPTWNGEKTLKRALDSIKNQSYKYVNFIISDDASTDKSVAILESEFKDFKNSSFVFRSKNVGAWENFLSRVKESKDDYLCWVCQDDQWDKDFLKELIDCSKKYEKLYGELPSLVGCGTYLLNNKKVFLKKSIENYDLDKKNSIQLAKLLLFGKKDVHNNKLNLILHGLIKVSNLQFLINNFPIAFYYVTNDRHVLVLLSSLGGIASSEKYLYLRDINLGIKLRQKKRQVSSNKFMWIKKPKFIQASFAKLKVLNADLISCFATIFILLKMNIKFKKKLKVCLVLFLSMFLDLTLFAKNLISRKF